MRQKLFDDWKTQRVYIEISRMLIYICLNISSPRGTLTVQGSTMPSDEIKLQLRHSRVVDFTWINTVVSSYEYTYVDMLLPNHISFPCKKLPSSDVKPHKGDSVKNFQLVFKNLTDLSSMIIHLFLCWLGYCKRYICGKIKIHPRIRANVDDIDSMVSHPWPKLIIIYPTSLCGLVQTKSPQKKGPLLTR